VPATNHHLICLSRWQRSRQGSLLSSDGYCRPDINRCIGLASSVMSALHNIWKDRYLSISTKIQSVLLYAAETWPPRASDIKALEAFHMKCQRQLLQISWQQFVRNDEVAVTTCLPSISEVISNLRNALFGHVARLQQDVLAHKAPHCHVDLSLGRPPNDQWKRHPGRPRERRIDQVRKDNGIPQRICGGVQRVVATEEQRYGPHWLCDDDDRTTNSQAVNSIQTAEKTKKLSTFMLRL